MTKLAGIAKNRNGCPIPATWFVRSDKSSCTEIRKRYSASGDEFASHTVTHKNLSADVSTKTIIKEINGARNYLINECGLPKEVVKGFRGPYRTITTAVRKVKT